MFANTRITGNGGIGRRKGENMAKKKPVDGGASKADLKRLQEECAVSEHEMNELNQEIYERTKELFIRKQELAVKISTYQAEIMRCECKVKQG